MNAEILSVGTELLMGQIVNSDAAYLSKGLNELGINVFYHTVVGDNPRRVKERLKEAFSRSDLILTTGGLGPTEDDLTKEMIAEFLGLAMVEHKPTTAKLNEFFCQIGRTMTPNNLKQAYFPEGSIILENPNGTAPGCLVEKDGRTIVVLPGPPRELIPMFDDWVRPYLVKKTDAQITSRMLHIFGMGESEVAHRLGDLIEKQTNPTLATYVGNGEVMLRITAKTSLSEDASMLLDPMVHEVRERLQNVVFSADDETLPEYVVKELMRRGETLAVAESCTGGMLSSFLVDVPGVSAVFLEGAVTYANEAKMRRLGVSEEILTTYGAVSQECAAAMAQGMRESAGADWALAITGIAGPDGGSIDKPVGLVYVALAGETGVKVECYHMRRDRAVNRRNAAMNALDLLRRQWLGALKK